MAVESIQVTPSSDGILRFGDADPAPSTDVTADTDVANATPVEGGTAFALDLETLFDGDDLGDGTITPVILKGTLAGIGLAFAGTTISGTQVRGPAVELRARWQNDSDALDRRSTNRFSIIVQDPLAEEGDELAPTQVVRLSAESNGTVLTVTCDPPSDPHDGTDPGSGMDKLQYYNGATLLAEETIAPGVSPAYTSGDIGTNAIAGTSDEDGAGGVDTSEGFFGENSGVAAFADRFLRGRTYVHSGSFIRSVRVDSFTGSGVSDSAKAALMIRAGLEADDPFWCVQVRKSLGVRVEERLVKGGSRVTYGAGQGVTSLPCWLRQRYIASTGVLTDEISQNGRDFTLLRERVVTLPPVFYSHRATCSTTDGVQVSVAYEHDSFTTSAPIVKNITTAVTGPIKVRGADQEGNVGPFSAEVTALSAEVEGGLVPGFNLYLRPGYVIGAGVGSQDKTDYVSKLNNINNRWYQFFTTSPNRSVIYRPPGSGIVGAIVCRSKWRFQFVNESVLPSSIAQLADHTWSGWDWSMVDAWFNTPCVLNDNAYVLMEMGEINANSPALPAFMVNAPFLGTFYETLQTRYTPCYHRFIGPDERVPPQSNKNLSLTGYPVVEYMEAMHQALHDHIAAIGKIDKVLAVSTAEVFIGTPTLPADWNLTDFHHGIGLLRKKIQQIWAADKICVTSGSGGSNQRAIQWSYVAALGFAMNYPDMKLGSFSNWPPDSRMQSPDGVIQSDIRRLQHATETNGIREFTFFPAGFDSPWTHNNVTVPQIAEHVVWAISGPPKGAIKDSSLLGLANGRSGDDPAGPLPCHAIVPQWGASNAPAYAPTLADWHRALDIFGPGGTFAFPHLPPGFKP